MPAERNTYGGGPLVIVAAALVGSLAALASLLLGYGIGFAVLAYFATALGGLALFIALSLMRRPRPKFHPRQGL